MFDVNDVVQFNENHKWCGCLGSVDFQAVADDKDVLFTLIDAERPYRESWRDDVEC